MDVIDELLVSSQLGIQLVGISIFILPNTRSHYGSWFEGTIHQHSKEINHIMSEARSFPISHLSIVVHAELTTRHLMHTVIDSLVCVENSLEEGVLDGEETSGGFGGLISGACIDKDAQLNISWDAGGFGEYCESVGELSRLVLGLFGCHLLVVDCFQPVEIGAVKDLGTYTVCVLPVESIEHCFFKAHRSRWLGVLR